MQYAVRGTSQRHVARQSISDGFFIDNIAGFDIPFYQAASVPVNKHFYMTAKLDNTRVNRDVQNYLQEIIQHLMAVDGSQVELKLDVDVVAPNGIPASTVRTVSENCRTLKIEDFGFDD